MQAVLALLNQTLRADCRQWTTGLLRAVAATVVLIALMITNAVAGTATGLYFAGWLLWLDYAGITLAAFSWFSAAIAEEREHRTLGLLRMTGVSSLSLLLGKWLPRLLIVLLLLAIQYPLAVLAITMGGVTHYQLQAGYVALLAYAVMMSGVGLLCSTICHNSRQASWWTGAFWLTHTLGPPLVKLFLRGGPFGGLLRIPAWLSSPIREVANSLHGLSLFRRLGWILSIGGDESVIDVQVISNFSIGIAAFALGWFALDRVALYRLESEPARPRRLAGILRLGRRPRQLRRPSFAGRCWRTALAWKDFHFLAGGWRFLISKSLVYPFAAIAVLAFASTTGSIPWRQICDQMGAGVLMTIGGTGLLLETSGLASRLFNAEIQQGTLGELMLLPKSIAEISYAKALGMALTLVPAAATFVAGCLMDFEVSGLFFGGMFTVSGLLTMAWYLLFLHLGVWFSIHFRIGGMLLSFVCCYLMLPLAEITRLLLFSGKWETGVQGFLLIIAAMATVGLHVQIGRSVLRKGRL